MAPGFSVIFAFVLSLLIQSDSSSLGSSASGKSTYYGGNPSGGACGFEDVEIDTFPYGYYTAAGSDSFDSGYGCGSCYEITCIGPNDATNTGCTCDSEHPTVTVQILDQCSECEESHFDLDPTSMAYIVGDGLSGTCGVIETTYERVTCDVLSNIKIRSKSGTSSFWYGLHIDDVANYGGISSVQIQSDGSSSYETTCDKSGGPSYWACSGGFPLTSPLTVKLTDSNGNVLVGNDVITSFDGGASFDFGSNFYTDATAQPTVTTTTTTKVPSPTTALTAEPTSGDLGDVVIAMHTDNQEWWISFYLNNLNSCSETVTDVSIWYNGVWYASTDSEGNWYAFDNDGVSFYESTPLSVKIETSDGSYEFTDAITNADFGYEYDIDWNLCDSTTTSTTSTTTSTTDAPTSSSTTTTTDTPTSSTTTTTTDAPTSSTTTTTTEAPDTTSSTTSTTTTTTDAPDTTSSTTSTTDAPDTTSSTTTTTEVPDTSSSTTSTTSTSTSTSTTDAPESTSSSTAVSNGNVVITMENESQIWWISLSLDNLNDCSESISTVYVFYENSWYSQTQNIDNWYAFNNNGVDSFENSIPISIKIVTNAGTFTFDDVITGVSSGNEYTIDWNLCDHGTSEPTATSTSSTTAQSPPTPQPTTSTTSETESPTKKSETGNLYIENYNGDNEWWYAVYIQNVADDIEIDKIEFKDASMSDWEESGHSWIIYYWQCNSDLKPEDTTNGCPFELPFDFRVTDTNGDVITGYDMIDDLDQGTIAYFDDNFASSAAVSNQNNDANSDNDFDMKANGSGEYSIGEVVVICLIVFVLIAVVCTGLYYYYGHIYRPKHYSKSGTDGDELEMNPTTPEIEVSVEINATQAIVAAEDDD